MRFLHRSRSVLLLAAALLAASVFPAGCRDRHEVDDDDATPVRVGAVAYDGRVKVYWDPVPGAASYNLYWSASPGVTRTTGTQIPGATSPYVHAGLANGTTLYYVVTSVDGTGESEESIEVSATPTAGTAQAGINWSRACASASWAPRIDHASAVFQNKMWVLAGMQWSSGSDLADVWHSDDGFNWTCATAAAPWGSRSGSTSVAFQSQIWILGGQAG
jgi:hypothetical protein